MSISRNKLYGIILTTCFAGVVWIWLHFSSNTTPYKGLNFCLLKNLFNIPCPSCGATRSVLLMMNGQIMEALYMNPIGIFIVAIILFAPIWILYDLLIKGTSLLNFYIKIEGCLKKPAYAIPMILFILINWIWNIKKGI